jgi:hypothetical protein
MNNNKTNSSLVYANLMNEAKARINAVSFILQTEAFVPNLIIEEFCLLQFRMICEIVAIGCLVAHDDTHEATTSQIRSEFSANSIMKKLEDLDLDFYPRPLTLSKNSLGLHAEDIQNDFLSKDDLLKLYAICNSRLHIGNLKNILKEKRNLTPDLNKVTKINDDFKKLLNQHRISLLGGEKQFMCTMAIEDQKILASVAIGEHRSGARV